MDKPILACGCAPSAHRDDGTPSCPIHDTTEVAQQQPDLTGRTARCAYGGAEVPSSTALAFFEYRGAGSPDAENLCAVCGYHERAHHPREDRNGWQPPETKGHEFAPHGAFDHDRYYCGCHGWTETGQRQ